jgi:lipoic acid synthetase
MPGAMDESEPQRLAQAAKALNLRHVVVTSAARDDLPDGGASVFAECIRQLHRHVPSAVVEVLVPDFNGDTAAINTVMQAAPDIFNHNIETVERLTPLVRSHRAAYRQSLDVLAYAKAYCRRDRMNPAPSRGGVKTKSGLMLGLGETRGEVLQALADLRGAGCEYVTIGQYLQPSAQHLKVQSFVPVSEFQLLREEALRMGFERVASGPLVRSSYFADQLHAPEELS